MYRINTPRTLVSVFAVLLTGLLMIGCGKKQERTRDTDREELKRMVAQMESLTNRHKPSGFDKYVGLSFDAAAFVYAVWGKIEADDVTFNPVRLRIASDEARIILEAKYLKGDSVVAHRYFGLEAMYEDEKWEFTSYDNIGTELNESVPLYR